jgi:hypothetical protein
MRAAPAPPPRDTASIRFTLPVSGIAVMLHQPAGIEEVLLAERMPGDPALALALVERLAEGDPAPVWGALPLTDIDTVIVRLRQMLIGDRIVAETACAAASCASPVDMSFGLEAYLAHHVPRARAPFGHETRMPSGRGWRVAPCAEAPGWHAVLANGVEKARFRLPCIDDQIAVHGRADAGEALFSRCIVSDKPPAKQLACIGAAMEALAPLLGGALTGQCPACGAEVAAQFNARLYCLQELHERSGFVYDDVDALAERYHWSEQDILSLPKARRAQYAERARQGLAA